MDNLTPTSPACKNSAHPASRGAAIAVLHEAVSAADALQARGPLEPYKPEADPASVLDTSTRSEHIGGKTQRPPPSADQWLALLPPLGSVAWAGASGEFSEATDAELVERMGWVYEHRGRLGGLSALDYAWQHEAMQARSLNAGFFMGRKRATTAYTNDLPDALALVLVGDDPKGYRRRLLAMLVTADRMRKWGFRIGAPDGAAVLGCSVASWWRVVAWAERMGYLYRVHTFKPGTRAPVQLSANFYGAGPALIEHRGAYSVTDATDAGKLYDLYARELSKSRKRWREARRATVARYRGELPPAEPGAVLDIAAVLDESEAAQPFDPIEAELVREVIREKTDRYAFERMEAEAAAYFAGLEALAPREGWAEPAKVSPDGETAKASEGNQDDPQTCRSAPPAYHPAHQLPSHADMGPPSGVKFRKLRRNSRRSFPADALAVSPSGDTLAGSAHPIEGTGQPPGYFEIKPDPVQSLTGRDSPERAEVGPPRRGKSQAKISPARSPSLAVTLNPSDHQDDDQ